MKEILKIQLFIPAKSHLEEFCRIKTLIRQILNNNHNVIHVGIIQMISGVMNVSPLQTGTVNRKVTNGVVIAQRGSLFCQQMTATYCLTPLKVLDCFKMQTLQR